MEEGSKVEVLIGKEVEVIRISCYKRMFGYFFCGLDIVFVCLYFGLFWLFSGFIGDVYFWDFV